MMALLYMAGGHADYDPAVDYQDFEMIIACGWNMSGQCLPQGSRN